MTIPYIKDTVEQNWCCLRCGQISELLQEKQTKQIIRYLLIRRKGIRRHKVSARIPQEESVTSHTSSSLAEPVVITSRKKALVNQVPQRSLSSKELQKLIPFRKCEGKWNNPEGEFFRRRKLPGRRVEYEVEHLILLKQCRKTVLEQRMTFLPVQDEGKNWDKMGQNDSLLTK